MDIKKKKEADEPVKSVEKENSGLVKYKAGAVTNVDSKLILPPAIQLKLNSLGQKYGLDFDLSAISLDGTMAEKVKAFRKIVEMMEGDSKLLPEMLRLVKRMMKCEISLAKYHKGCVTASVRHQEKLDKVTADIFLKMAGYQSSSQKRELRTNSRNELKVKRSEAYKNYYNQSVFGAESELIDLEFELAASNQQIAKETKTKRKKYNSDSKQRIAEYVQSAYED